MEQPDHSQRFKSFLQPSKMKKGDSQKKKKFVYEYHVTFRTENLEASVQVKPP